MGISIKENTFTILDKNNKERSITLSIVATAVWCHYGVDADGNRGQWQWDDEEYNYNIPTNCDDGILLGQYELDLLDKEVDLWCEKQNWEYEEQEPDCDDRDYDINEDGR